MRVIALAKSSPRKVIASMGTLLLAAAVAIGSGANYNSTSANPSNIVTAGVVKQSNSSNNAAVLTVAHMAPGATLTGTVDLTNTGDLNSAFTLAKSNLTDTPASPAFSGKLDLKVEDLGDPGCVSGCPSAVTKYTGKLGVMGSLTLGTFAPNEKHRYKFSVTYPDGGTNGADNAYQGASTTVDYSWTSANA